MEITGRRRLRRLIGQLTAAEPQENCVLTVASTAALAAAGGSVPPRVLLEFFFDTTSPWTYLAFSRIRELCIRTGAELSLRPVLVGGVFNVANKELYASRDAAIARASGGRGGEAKDKKRAGPSAKDVWSGKDALAWSAYLGLDIKPLMQRLASRAKNGAPGHPISAVKTLRGAMIVQREEGDEALIRYAFACFDAYWGRLLDVSDDGVIRQLHAEAGLAIDVDEFMRRLASDEAKDLLRANTDELVRRGGFGSPTMFVSGPDGPPGFREEMHWGNDRIELVQAAVLRAAGRPWRFHDTYGVPRSKPTPFNLPKDGWAQLSGKEGENAR